MPPSEIVVNLHIHSKFSDGSGTYAGITKEALAAGLDAFIITDHNVYVWGKDGNYGTPEKPLIGLIGEEIHDTQRVPQKNHLLIFNTNVDLSRLAGDPQSLINEVDRRGGLCFIAHPDDQAMARFHEPEINWIDWNVTGYTGIELWNGLSELKFESKNFLYALFYALFPSFLPHGPNPKTLERWDTLLNSGRRICAIGGADAHALIRHAGPFTITIFPYRYHFNAINNHLLIEDSLNGEITHDQKLIYSALRRGSFFIANDLYVSSKGFRFTASTQFQNGAQGDDIQLQGGVTLQVSLPCVTECRLLCNGEVVRTWKNHVHCTYITNHPGVYRVEVYLNKLGARRAWIFSNPIYIRG